MAKKEKVIDEKAQKEKAARKRRRGCGCAIASLAIFILVVVAGAGVGAYFADGYLQSNFGIGVFDAIGMVGDLGTPSRDKVVNNSTTESDKQTLYQSFDEKLMLKSGTLTENALNDILNEIFGLNTGQSGQLLGGSGSGLSPTIESLIKKENVDYSRVRATFTDDYDYDENYERDFVITLSDRQLKIFAEKLLFSNLEKMSNEIADLLKKVTFEQLKMTRLDDKPYMSIVVRLDVDAFVNAYMPEGMEFFSTVALAFLPDELYITLNAKLDEVKNEYSFSFNAMNDETQAKMHKLLQGILKLTGQEKTNPNDYVYDMIDSSVVSFIDSASKWIDIKNVTTDGYVTLDLYKIIADAVSSDMTAREFVELYTSVLIADANRMIEQNQDKLFKEMSDGENPVYSSEKVQREFMQEFHGKYLLHEDFYLDKDAGDGEKKVYFIHEVEDNPTLITSLGLTHYTLSFADVSALFGVGESAVITELSGYGVNLESLLDTTGLMAEKYGEVKVGDRNKWFVKENRDDLQFNFTDKMLAALIDSQLDSVLGDMNGALDGFELEFISIEKGESEQVSNSLIVNNTSFENYQVDINRIFVTLGFIVDTQGLTSSLNDLVAEIMPEKVGFIIKLDITPTLITSALNAPQLRYCDLSSSRTESVVNLLKKMGITLLTDQQINENLVKPMRDMFNKMSETMGNISVENGKIVLSDIFQIIVSHGFAPKPEVDAVYGERVEISADEIQSLLQGLLETPSIASDGAKEYLSDEPTAIESANGVLGCANLYYGGKTNDRVKADKFNANFIQTAKETFGVSLDKVGAAVGYHNADGERYMYLTFAYDLSSYLYEQDMCLLPIKTVYATFVIDKEQVVNVGGVNAFASKLSINGMSETQMNALEKMLVFGNVSNYGKFAQLEGEVGVLAKLIVDSGEALLEG